MLSIGKKDHIIITKTVNLPKRVKNVNIIEKQTRLLLLYFISNYKKYKMRSVQMQIYQVNIRNFVTRLLHFIKWYSTGICIEKRGGSP